MTNYWPGYFGRTQTYIWCKWRNIKESNYTPTHQHQKIELAKHHQRAKHEKLDDETIKSIIFDLNKKNASVKSLAHRYYWSKSTIYNVKCQKNYYLNGDSKRHIRKLSNNEEKDIERTIKNYLATHHLPWTVSDVTKYTNDKLLKVFPSHAIRKIMINNAKLSYKR